MSNLPVLPLSSIPQNFKSVAHFVKIANEYAGRDIVIYYWCMFKAVDDAMKIDSSSPEAKQFLITLVDVLEQIKNTHKNDDNITQNLVAQSHIEDQAQKLFQYAKSQDDAEQYNQKMVKAFYTCGYLFDVLTMFGTLDENIQSAQKFAKWRATHIFGCLKKGEQPTSNRQNSRENSQQPNQFSGRVGDIAAEINDELSAELNALNASINGPPVPVTTNIQPANSFRNEFGFQPQNFGDGAYPHIGQQPNMFNAPRPGLQEPPFRPPPPTQQQPAAKPRASGQYPHHQQAEPVKPMVAAQMSPQPAQNLKLEDYLDAKKYTKFASSALDYEDPKTAIDYLQKAIAVLQKQPIP